MNQAARQTFGEFDEDSEIAHRRNHGVKRVEFTGEKLPVEIFHAFQFHRFLFGFTGDAFGFGNVVRKFRQFVESIPARAEQGPVDNEVGVPANRRGEMRVIFFRQPEMSHRLRRVPSLFERPE